MQFHEVGALMQKQPWAATIIAFLLGWIAHSHVSSEATETKDATIEYIRTQNDTNKLLASQFDSDNKKLDEENKRIRAAYYASDADNQRLRLVKEANEALSVSLHSKIIGFAKENQKNAVATNADSTSLVLSLRERAGTELNSFLAMNKELVQRNRDLNRQIDSLSVAVHSLENNYPTSNSLRHKNQLISLLVTLNMRTSFRHEFSKDTPSRTIGRENDATDFTINEIKRFDGGLNSDEYCLILSMIQPAENRIRLFLQTRSYMNGYVGSVVYKYVDNDPQGNFYKILSTLKPLKNVP